MKSLDPKPWMAPMPALIIGTYNEDGKPDLEKMQLISYDPIRHGYLSVGKRVGNAFSDGKQLK